MPLALNNNRGIGYSRRMEIEVPERWCLTDISGEQGGCTQANYPRTVRNVDTFLNVFLSYHDMHFYLDFITFTDKFLTALHNIFNQHVNLKLDCKH